MRNAAWEYGLQTLNACDTRNMPFITQIPRSNMSRVSAPGILPSRSPFGIAVEMNTCVEPGSQPSPEG
jgi:hypothetical protein